MILGVRVLPWIWNLPPTTNLFYPIFAKCVELDIPFCTQVGHTGPLCPSEPGRPIPYIDQVTCLVFLLRPESLQLFICELYFAVMNCKLLCSHTLWLGCVAFS